MPRTVVLLPLLIAGCAALPQSPAERTRAEKLAYAPAGQPIDCLRLSDIRETRILDDRTIDFVTRGGERYRNTLPTSCPGLSFNDGISYSTSLARLCRVDTFTVLHRVGLVRGATCGFAEFQPVRRIAG